MNLGRCRSDQHHTHPHTWEFCPISCYTTTGVQVHLLSSWLLPLYELVHPSICFWWHSEHTCRIHPKCIISACAWDSEESPEKSWCLHTAKQQGWVQMQASPPESLFRKLSCHQKYKKICYESTSCGFFCISTGQRLCYFQKIIKKH